MYVITNLFVGYGSLLIQALPPAWAIEQGISGPNWRDDTRSFCLLDENQDELICHRPLPCNISLYSSLEIENEKDSRAEYEYIWIDHTKTSNSLNEHTHNSWKLIRQATSFWLNSSSIATSQLGECQWWGVFYHPPANLTIPSPTCKSIKQGVAIASDGDILIWEINRMVGLENNHPFHMHTNELKENANLT